jgi:hypothetical protein
MAKKTLTARKSAMGAYKSAKKTLGSSGSSTFQSRRKKRKK